VANRLRTRTPDGGEVTVDARDVGTWAGVRWTADGDAGTWSARAAGYVAAHPRAASQGIAAAQRLLVLRRLAAGPASALELLATLRGAGWVGAADLENRLRDLRAADSRAGAAQRGVAVVAVDGRYRLAEPFPLLDDADRRALGFAKAIVGGLNGPLAGAAAAALDHLLPGVAAGRGRRARPPHRARAQDFERFEQARVDRRAVRVRYFSLNSGREWTYLLVPVEYVTLGATLKAICVGVGADGARAEVRERQFAMDRVLAVERAPDQPATPPRDLRLARSPLVMDVTAALYEVLQQRDVFGLGEAEHAEPLGYDDVWRVRGTFPMALAWDVMEQLCAWSGQVQVREPLWLVNAVVRRLTAGLRVMEEGAGFVLVKPEPERAFADHGEAVRALDPLPPPSGPRKLPPPR
jgi:hypothetical protein